AEPGVKPGHDEPFGRPRWRRCDTHSRRASGVRGWGCRACLHPQSFLDRDQLAGEGDRAVVQGILAPEGNVSGPCTAGPVIIVKTAYSGCRARPEFVGETLTCAADGLFQPRGADSRFRSLSAHHPG